MKSGALSPTLTVKKVHHQTKAEFGYYVFPTFSYLLTVICICAVCVAGEFGGRKNPQVRRL